ncbi:MAG: VIT1/CCC1 transporter family protein [Simkaniaceae bacterium]|nr:VIT1/CCC1 transporter family protein [Simkaniaceae bacterium]
MHDHFKGKSALEHLADARVRTAKETGACHGIEAPGHLMAGADAAKETALITTIVWLVLESFPATEGMRMLMLCLGFIGWLVWKIGRSALLAWGRLDKLHRVIAEEKKEIDTNREQEREELTEMYRARGFSGKLLDDVIDVLMADDNRLLEVMLDEELGLRLESFEHPLKQAFGCGVGVFGAAILLWIGLLLGHTIGLVIAGLVVIYAASWMSSKLERNARIPAIVWNMAIFVLGTGSTWFLTRILR